MRTVTRQFIPVLLALVGAVALWELLRILTGAPDYLLPSPVRVWETGWGDRLVLGAHLRATTQIAVTGFVIGVLLGVVMATVLGLSHTLRRATEPLLIASQAIPPVIFAPLLIAAMGFGAWPKILVVTLGAFFPVAVSASAAMRGVDSAYIDVLAAMGASRFTILRRVRLPGAVPGIVSGARVAATYVVFSAIIAEWMGATSGLGVYLQRSQAAYRTDQMFAAVLTIAALGVLLFWATSFIGDRILFRPQPTHHRKVSHT